MITQYMVVDTSALMRNPEKVEELIQLGDSKIVVSTTVLEELDKHKDGIHNDAKFKARRAIKVLNKYHSDIMFIVHMDNMVIPGYDMSRNDNKIVACAVSLNPSNSNKSQSPSVTMVTCDLGMTIKCRQLKLDCISVDVDTNSVYKGYLELKCSDSELDSIMCDIMPDMFVNQYLVHTNVDSGEDTVYRWTGDDFIKVRIPVGKLKPKNSLQMCAMDLINNTNIPIKVILGNYGSGKTMLATMGSEKLCTQGLYDTLLLVRNPIPVDNIDIGALPGDKHDKVGAYFKSMTQYIDSYQDDGYGFHDIPEHASKTAPYELKMEIPSFMKGMSVERTMMLVDECEDLSVKLLKMLGTRVGKGSAICFMGDFKQAEKQYQHDNGILEFVDKCKGNPLVGIITLDEDVRSSVSKVFADL